MANLCVTIPVSAACVVHVSYVTVLYSFLLLIICQHERPVSYRSTYVKDLLTFQNYNKSFKVLQNEPSVTNN